MRKNHNSLYCRSLLALAAMLLASSPDARAAGTPPAFLPASSSITMTQYPDTAFTPNNFAVTVPGSLIPAASSGFQLSNTNTAGLSNSVADGGIYETTNAAAMAVDLVSGTGITQHNAGAYESGAELDVSVNTEWKIGTGGFPQPGHFPGVTYSFNIGGNVGAGGSAGFTMDLDYYDIVGGNPTLVGTATIDSGFTTPGAFTHLFTSSVLLNGGIALPANSTLELTGDIIFQATDPFDPTTINLIDDGSVGVTQDVVGAAPLPASSEMCLAGMCLVAGAAIGKKCRALPPMA